MHCLQSSEEQGHPRGARRWYLDRGGCDRVYPTLLTPKLVDREFAGAIAQTADHATRRESAHANRNAASPVVLSVWNVVEKGHTRVE